MLTPMFISHALLAVFATQWGRVDSQVVGASAPAVTPQPDILPCGDAVTECKSKFERIRTVYQFNSTTTEFQWHTSNRTLPVSTYNVTEIEVVTTVNATTTEGLCDEVHTVTLPGTSVVTVSVNATSIRSIVPRTTVTIKQTITQYETASSVCRMKETIMFPGPTYSPMAAPPQQQQQQPPQQQQQQQEQQQPVVDSNPASDSPEGEADVAGDDEETPDNKEDED